MGPHNTGNQVLFTMLHQEFTGQSATIRRVPHGSETARLFTSWCRADSSQQVPYELQISIKDSSTAWVRFYDRFSKM